MKEIDAELIALVPEEIRDRITDTAEGLDRIERRELLTLIGAIVRERDQARAERDTLKNEQNAMRDYFIKDEHD